MLQEPIPAATGETSEPQHIEDAYSGEYFNLCGTVMLHIFGCCQKHPFNDT